MPQILCYRQTAIAVIELLPNNALGSYLEEIEGELCMLLSPDEGQADIVDVTDEELEQLRRGEIVQAVAQSGDCDEDEH